jgi:hypothetical protein
MRLHTWLALAAITLAACDKTDDGKDCTPADDTAGSGSDVGNSGGESVTFPATERKDGQCESFSCVSTQVRRNYCSHTCASQRDCMDGFVCATLQPVGPLKETQFCLLAKSCRPTVPTDCPRETMDCVPVTTSDPEKPEYFCDLKPAKS